MNPLELTHDKDFLPYKHLQTAVRFFKLYKPAHEIMIPVNGVARMLKRLHTSKGNYLIKQ